jgi:RimJ/RimL family protein N-acetyltransferase
MSLGCVLEGDKVRLRPVEEGDLAHLVTWLSDMEVRRWLAMSEAPPPTLESEQEWYQQRKQDPTCVLWSIESEGGRLVGDVGLGLIDKTHRRAEVGIFIGDKSFWGRGLGADAISRVLRYAFDELGLRRVQLYVDEDNLRAIRCYKKCGFVREGLLRSYRLREGKPVNEILMAALREEFER